MVANIFGYMCYVSVHDDKEWRVLGESPQDFRALEVGSGCYTVRPTKVDRNLLDLNRFWPAE
jgi:hypothetical protein